MQKYIFDLSGLCDYWFFYLGASFFELYHEAPKFLLRFNKLFLLLVRADIIFCSFSSFFRLLPKIQRLQNTISISYFNTQKYHFIFHNDIICFFSFMICFVCSKRITLTSLIQGFLQPWYVNQGLGSALLFGN